MNTKRIILGALIIIVMLILGGAAGYYIGKMHKDEEVAQAKSAASSEALQQVKKDDEKSKSVAHEKTPPKIVSETTCNADELALAVTSSSESGAGTLAYNVVLTNMGKRACTLGGFPGVSLVNDNGNQIGSPAARANNYEEKKLTLTPNAKVKAVVSISNSSNFSDGQCKMGATKLRVYPPNDTGYLSVATTIDSWCPGFMISPVLAM